MRSFDVFDTLIARRCIEPTNLFQQIGVQYGNDAFAHMRVQAEQALHGKPHTLDDIYQEYARLGGISLDEARVLMAAELQAEAENAIPITDNCQQVQSGDMLISDMYLNPHQIGGLLRQAGFDKDVQILQSNAGKASGTLWQTLAALALPLRHLGDHPQADVAMARQNGVSATLSTTHRLNPFEAYLRQSGMELLARCCRETRLRASAQGFFQSELRDVQLGVNAPVLFLSTILVLQLCRAHKMDRVLFSSRDCFLWLKLARRLGWFEQFGIDARYFYTSRLAKTKLSPDYLDYLQSLDIGNALILDLCGTGWSCRRLQQQLDQPLRLFFINYLGKQKSGEIYPAEVELAVEPEMHFIFKQTNFDNALFEALNYADHGTVKDVRKGPLDTYLPLMDGDALPREIEELVAYSHGLFELFAETLGNYDLDSMFEQCWHSAVPLVEVIRTLYGNLGRKNQFYAAFASYHNQENSQAVAELWHRENLPVLE